MVGLGILLVWKPFWGTGAFSSGEIFTTWDEQMWTALASNHGVYFPLCLYIHGLLPLTLIYLYHGFCGKKNHLSYPRALPKDLWATMVNFSIPWFDRRFWEIVASSIFDSLWFRSFLLENVWKCSGRHPPWWTCVYSLAIRMGLKSTSHQWRNRWVQRTTLTPWFFIHQTWHLNLTSFGFQMKSPLSRILFSGFTVSPKTLQGHTEKV